MHRLDTHLEGAGVQGVLSLFDLGVHDAQGLRLLETGPVQIEHYHGADGVQLRDQLRQMILATVKGIVGHDCVWWYCRIFLMDTPKCN